MDGDVRALMEQIEDTRQQLYRAKSRGAKLVVSRRIDALAVEYHRMVSPVSPAAPRSVYSAFVTMGWAGE